MATHSQRVHLEGLMRFLIAHEPQVHYRQVRPMQSVRLSEQVMLQRLRLGGSLTMDCSEAVTALCMWAGLHDPNGRGYDGRGYTGTLLSYADSRGAIYHEPRNAGIGALVVFGPASGEHVCMVLEPDADNGDPLLFSHGQERGPLAVRLAAERRAHHDPVRLISIARL